MPPHTAAAGLNNAGQPPPPYPIPTRGTTLGRFCTTCGLAPPRPIIPPGIPPPVPIGMGIIGMPPIGAPATPVIAAASGIPAAPSPDIAELARRAGIDPCHDGGTDIEPTNRPWPKPADTPAPPNPAPPPDGFTSGRAPPTNFAASGTAPAAPVSPAPPCTPPCVAALISIINGDIAVLAGVASACTPEVSACNNDCGDGVIGGAGGGAAGGSDAAACVANREGRVAKPAKLFGGIRNGVNMEATDTAPA